MNKITAEVSKALKVIATRLPTVLNETKEYHYLTGAELKEMEIFKDDNGNDLIDAIKYRWSFPVQLASNHFRILKKAYQRGGEPEVIRYIKKVKALHAA